jgi:protein phosphatase
VLFLFVLIAIVAAALFAISVYARGSYYVGLDNDRVTIFQGRVGGLLWFDPTVKQRTDLTAADVPPAYIDDVRNGKEEGSLAEARRYVRNLKEAAAQQAATTTTTTAPPAPPAP